MSRLAGDAGRDRKRVAACPSSARPHGAANALLELTPGPEILAATTATYAAPILEGRRHRDRRARAVAATEMTQTQRLHRRMIGPRSMHIRGGGRGVQGYARYVILSMHI